ncbi:hypothetical protein ACLMJK_001989 [Lecanora helva]
MLELAEGTRFYLKCTTANSYLGTRANAQYAGAEVVLTDCESRSEWSFKAEQDAHYLINCSVPGLCLNVAYESTAVGAHLQQWDCNGGSSELWTLVPTSRTNVLLVNKNSGLAAGVSDTTCGSPIVQANPSHDDPLALWELVFPDEPTDFCKSSEVFHGEGNTVNPGLCHTNVRILEDEIVYNIYVPTFSSAGTLNEVTKDLSRIANFGFSTILLMPVHPIGVPTTMHPAFDSPYAVADFSSIDPALGRLSDFAALVKQAHALGLKVLMDVVLNHTAWTHPFISQRPDFYVHTDRRKNNTQSIAEAFWFQDVAQLDYKSTIAVRDYMTAMLEWWMRELHIDGFRFDTVDNPYGSDRMIPASVWSYIGKALKAINPKAILLGECTNPELSLKPFNLDCTNYSLQPAVVNAIRGQNASGLRKVLHELKSSHPKGMLHTSIMQTWDMDLDLKMYGGPDETLVAAVFNFTIEGIPMILAGEEIGNDCGGLNTHSLINWNSHLASRFRAFYKSIGELRRRDVALRRGSTTWLEVSCAESALVAFVRTCENFRTFVAINFSASGLQGRVKAILADGEWTEVTPPSGECFTAHPTPPDITLGPWDFVIFTRRGEHTHQGKVEDKSFAEKSSQPNYSQGWQSRMRKVFGK